MDSLFRLLCDAGDEVLVARPSYPLFDFLADLEDVRLRSIHSSTTFGWWIILLSWSGASATNEGILVVHPNTQRDIGRRIGGAPNVARVVRTAWTRPIVDEFFWITHLFKVLRR